MQQPPTSRDGSPSLQRGSRCSNHRRSLKFPDVLPERLSALPPPEAFLNAKPDSTTVARLASSSQTIPSPSVERSTPSRSLYASIRKLFKTQTNKFGLFRIYNTDSPPRHDPEDPHSIENTRSPVVEPQPSKDPYYPYPNESSMRLGDWYWNRGVQKSKEDFRKLLDIVGDSTFSPSAISQTAWATVDSQLGHNQFDGNVPEWLGEDEGWKHSSITISVPFHKQSRSAGAKDYKVDNFYHRSLVSIIKEKITNPVHSPLFHLEPYELRWHPPHRDHDLKIHSDLFTSTAFLDAHQALQDGPSEPGCDLPRVVVALMLWSDATQLTAFGDAKLWPVYMFFGNESKLRRSQPTNHLCSHVAYFQGVSVQCPCQPIFLFVI